MLSEIPLVDKFERLSKADEKILLGVREKALEKTETMPPGRFPDVNNLRYYFAQFAKAAALAQQLTPYGKIPSKIIVGERGPYITTSKEDDALIISPRELLLWGLRSDSNIKIQDGKPINCGILMDYGERIINPKAMVISTTDLSPLTVAHQCHTFAGGNTANFLRTAMTELKTEGAYRQRQGDKKVWTLAKGSELAQWYI